MKYLINISFSLLTLISMSFSQTVSKTGTTAAQFLKRFVGNTSWAHLDIAGVTWSKKGTNFARPGGTGFGVRLLDEFIKNYYER